MHSKTNSIVASGKSLGHSRMSRISSAPELYSIPLLNEIQFEAITKTPSYIAAACINSVEMPESILDKHDVNEELSLCIATPPDGECTRSLAKYKLTNIKGILDIKDAAENDDVRPAMERLVRQRRRRRSCNN